VIELGLSFENSGLDLGIYDSPLICARKTARSVKNHVTNIQLKSAKNIQILLKNRYYSRLEMETAAVVDKISCVTWLCNRFLMGIPAF